MQFCLLGFLACLLQGAEGSEISLSISSRKSCSAIRGPRERIRRGSALLRMSGSGEPGTFPHVDETGCRHHVIFPDPSAGCNLALVMVNYKLPKKLLELAWARAAVRICADGALNRLYYSFDTDEERRQYVPEYVRGDCDSLEAGVREYYASKGTKIVYDANQDTTDLEKCIDLLETLPLRISQARGIPPSPTPDPQIQQYAPWHMWRGACPMNSKPSKRSVRRFRKSSARPPARPPAAGGVCPIISKSPFFENTERTACPSFPSRLSDPPPVAAAPRHGAVARRR